MPYPGEFVRLVVIGKIYEDDFNFSLSIVPSALGELEMPPVDAPTLASMAGIVSTWFPKLSAANGPDILNDATLVSIKLNRLNASGHYMDPISREHVYPTPIAGGATGNAIPQLTVATSLLTAVPRGRGSRGRYYLPPTLHTTTVGTDGRLTLAQQAQVGVAGKNLIDGINTLYTLIGRVGVASSAGSGRFEHVTKVAVGRVVDTMRSRRSKLAEDHYETPIT